jgi:nitrite reductase (NO-forming)
VIAPGVTFLFMTFNGSVPGPAIVVCLGDWVELTIKNLAGNRFAHGIDLHAATGTMSGGAASVVGPGQQTTFQFQALKEVRSFITAQSRPS